jgi:hypothetical protein
LHELKQLLDDGVITQDDFDAKKRQILGLWIIWPNQIGDCSNGY